MLRTPPHILVTTPESLYLLLTAERSRADAAHRPHRHRRRDPRGDRHAPRRAPRAVARAAAAGRRAAAAADRPVGDAEADRGGRALSGRPATPTRRARSSTKAIGARWISASRCRARTLDAVMSHEVWEEYYDRLAALIERAPDDAGLRQHAADGRARRAPPERAARRRGGHRASRQPVEGEAARRRDAAEERAAAGARRDRVARARHRHRPRRSGLPDRIAAPDRHAAAARRPIGPHHRRHAEGPAVPGRRATTWSNARRCCASVRRGELDAIVSHDAPLDVLAQQIVAETRVPRLRAKTSCSRSCAARGRIARSTRADFDAVVRDDGRRLRDAARPPRARWCTATRSTRRVRGRRGARLLAHHVGRRDPRGRRLPRRARSGRHVHRHAERGLRDREQRRRRLPARQRVVAGPAGRGRHRPRRRREGRAADASRSGSARRRRAATSCRARSAICARTSIAAALTASRRRRAGVATTVDVAGRRRPASIAAAGRAGCRLPRRRPARARRASRRRRRSCSSGSSTSRAACSSCCTRRSAAASTRRGAWRCASASAGSSTSSCRRRRPKTRCCCRSGRSIRFRSPTSSATCIPATTRDVLVQAFLDAPVFQTRWRWNTTISLAVPRNRGGRKVPPQLQRMLADDLMAAVFPDAAACLENIPGDRADSRSSAGQPDGPRLPRGGDGLRRPARACSTRIHAGELRLRRARHARAVAASRTRSSTRGRTRSSTTRRSRSGGRRRCYARRAGEPSAPTTSARSTRPRSRACATRRVPIRATPTSCTTRC